MLIEFDFDHLYYPGSDAVMDMQTAQEMVEFLVRANLIFLHRAKALGVKIPLLYDSGVKYERVNEWQAIPGLYRRAIGDCKNLASALIAERRFHWNRPSRANFRWVPNADGTMDFHVLCQEGNSFEDPSLKLGMGQDEVAKFYAP